MRKLKLIKLAFLGSIFYIVICAYKTGAANNGYDCTGAETNVGNSNGCTTIFGGCHATSATANIAVSIELDSAGIPTKYYVGGGSYTVTISGVNNGSTNQPAFGFQLGCITGAAAVASATNAGTFNAPYPKTTQYTAPGFNRTVGVMEHSAPVSPTTGSGGNGTTYVKTFNWTAPAKGTGTISFWGALNAVNNNGSADAGDLWNTTHLVIAEINPAGIQSITADENISVYPNPFTSCVTFSFTNEVDKGTISLYNISGQLVKQGDFSGKETILNRDGLDNGIYLYTVVSGNDIIKTGKLLME